MMLDVWISTNSCVFICLIGEGLVERFLSILWSGTVSRPAAAAKRATTDSDSDSDLEPVRPAQYFLDRARLSCGGEYDSEEVDIVRDVMMTVPVFLTLIIFYAFTSQV